MKRAWNHSNGGAGFTLIELIVVVIIVGVLASIALPQYAGFVERAYVAEAVNAIGAIKVGEQVYRTETGVYLTCIDATQIATNLGITVDTTNWTYNTGLVPILNVFITATRTAANSGVAGQTINYIWSDQPQAGSWSGTHPNRPR